MSGDVHVRFRERLEGRFLRATRLVLIVKGSKAQAEAIRKACRSVLENSLKLRLNMDRTRITHVNEGLNFLGHRIIRKRSHYGDMRAVTTILRDKARNFAASLTILLSGNYSENKIDMAGQLNRKLKGRVVSCYSQYGGTHLDAAIATCSGDRGNPGRVLKS